MSISGPTIDRLTPVSRGSVWMWVVAGGERIAKVPAPVVKACGVAEGVVYGARLSALLAARTRAWLAQRDGVRLLRARARTKADVRARLIAKGHAAEDVEAAIAKLLAAGAISDAAVAEARVARHAAQGGASRALLRSELSRLGVERPVAEKAITEASPPTDAEAARRLTRATAAKLPARLAPAAALRKLLGVLARRGFDEETAMEAIAAECPRIARAASGDD